MSARQCTAGLEVGTSRSSTTSSSSVVSGGGGLQVRFGGQILPADPLAGVFQRDVFSLPEVLARHDEHFWSLQVRKVPAPNGCLWLCGS